ncbi:hypothetical protein SEA_DALANDE_96 [Gordonia phage DalanDe]|nr:hypothetical protein SEA_DALANDE_96 [Gordonia phage DalanDe]
MKKTKVIAKRRTSERRPVFTCPAHPSPLPMEYDGEKGRWICSDPDCNQQRKPIATGGTVTIREAPVLVLREDEDGDYRSFLFWQDHELIIEIPYSEVKVFRGKDGGKFLRWAFDSDHISMFNKHGIPE